MSQSLPERPDLDQLRRQAKELRDAAQRGDPSAVERFARYHPSAGQVQATLAVAQLVIARELGFASWPRLKAAVDAKASMGRSLPAFLAASVDARLRQAAVDIFGGDPEIASKDMRAAVVLGDVDAVRAMLTADPGAAVAVDDDRGWPPLLYACYSHWHQIDPDRAVRLAEVSELLLAAGASPRTNNGAFRNGYRSALHGAVEVNNPSVVQVLLEAGANPDDGRCIEQAADRHDVRCLELLLARGARVAGTWALGAAVYADDAKVVSLLIDALRTAQGETAYEATKALADAAAANASHQVVAVLLAAGADPQVSDSDAGLSALRCAVRAGDEETVSLLVRHGAVDDSTDVDRLIGACRAGDRQAVEQLIATHPDVQDGLTEQDRAVIVDAAATGPAEAVGLMLDLGFPIDVRKSGDQPLHAAAYRGNAAVVRVLLDRGADVDGRDGRFDGTPLAFATVGSGEQAGKPGEWTETVRLLIEGGASPHDVWVSGKPPSEEVAGLLRYYGIVPDEASRPAPADQAEAPGPTCGGVMSEVALHLEAAFRGSDLELLGSLLHPEVSWTGLCRNKADVLDWYRGFQAEGTLATVESVEVDRDAVILRLSVPRTAEGARPASPEEVWQAFTVVDAQVVDIRAYRDRASALGRP
ncbi:MAG TPA: ankyrin repeat domain-containing protein [Acidimicrobiales bacterium]|nr:ankyrin repeat domain-containing protein [Acidimicrobiales bacterium]